jgi:hypothetical protein
MGTPLFDLPNWVSMETVDCENDLKAVPGKINVNPPPEDGRCQCCGRHLSEVKPFGGPGDPLAGDFTGARLLKRFRPNVPPDSEAWIGVSEVLLEQLDLEKNADNLLQLLITRFGREKGRKFYDWYVGYPYLVVKSWECRDCACLNDLEHWDKRKEAALSRPGSSIHGECTKVTAPWRERGLKEEWEPFQEANVLKLKGPSRLIKVDLLVNGDGIVAWKYQIIK